MFEARRYFKLAGSPSVALGTLLDQQDIKHDNTIAGVHAATQAAWFHYDDRGKKRFRKDIGGRAPTEEEKLLLKDLGIFSEIVLTEVSHHADYAVLLGATVTAVRKRLALLVKEWQCGLRFDLLVGFGGMRILDQKEKDLLMNPDNPDLPFDKAWVPSGEVPGTEVGMIGAVFKQVANRMPWGQDGEPKVICAPQEGATTEDTAKTWMETKPVPGSVIAVSSQPFVWDQELALRRNFGCGFAVEAIGYEAPKVVTLGGYLSAIATLIHKLAT